MTIRRIPLASGILALALANPAVGQILFSEGFDSQASAKVAESMDGADAAITYVDYSSFTIGAANHAIPEAPNMIAGSASTRGVLIQSNLSGTATPVNLTALDGVGGNAVSFSGNYRVSFDMYLGLDPTATRDSAGTTEVGIWGVGHDGAVVLGRTNRAEGGGAAGTWGWLTTEGGFGTEDAVLIVNTFTGSQPAAKVSDGSNAGLFQDAFPDGAPITPAPNNSWVHVEVTVVDGNVSVNYNGEEFFNLASSATNGFALVGYEDPFGSLSFSPDHQFGLFDNFVVEVATLAVSQTTAFDAVNEEGAMTTGVFTISNGGGTTTTINEISFSGTDAAEFSLGTQLPIMVAAGGNATFDVTYTAAGDPGLQTADMEVASTDGQNPSITVPLEVVFSSPLLAHYKLDETSGTVMEDASGNATDGLFTITDPLDYAQMALASGTSIGFTEATFPPGGNFAFVPGLLHTPTTSISLWIRQSPNDTGESALFNRDPEFSGADAIYGCFVDALGTLTFRANSQIVLQSDPGTIVNDQTHHVVITHLDEDGFGNSTATRSRMYIDGQMAAENTSTTGFDAYPNGATTRSFYLATRSAANTAFTGLIDDVQIYSIELSPFQVNTMFEAPGSTALLVDPPRFEITRIDYDDITGTPTLTWNSLPGRTYKITSSTDLANWDNELVDAIESGGLMTVHEVLAVPPNTTELYLRVEEE